MILLSPSAAQRLSAKRENEELDTNKTYLTNFKLYHLTVDIFIASLSSPVLPFSEIGLPLADRARFGTQIQ